MYISGLHIKTLTTDKDRLVFYMSYQNYIGGSKKLSKILEFTHQRLMVKRECMN